MARRIWIGLMVLLSASACGGSGASQTGASKTNASPSETSETGALVVYSGRSEQLVGPLLKQFEQESGIDLQVKYAGTPELANAILEEGDNTPADVFFAQDAGSLGALAEKGRLSKLNGRLLDAVEPRFRSDDGVWVGTSGRSRVVAFNPERVAEADLPASVLDFTNPKWKGRIGWAPVNASFESFVTALRVLKGEPAAKEWLLGLKANGAATYPNNITIVDAVSKGEIDVGLVNHYYLYEMKHQNPGLKAENHFFAGGDVGGLVNVAGAGILKGTSRQAQAERFVEFLLGKEAQEYFAQKTYEYPLADGVTPVDGLRPLANLDPPSIDLSNLADLRGTQKLLADTGVL